ncbi:MAG: hypothetical protein PHX83_00120 [Acidobacteriia bacterium]|nr:hypothetical protein [Terriglobia bacterium]
MNSRKYRIVLSLLCLVTMLTFVSAMLGQDAVQVAGKEYKLISENDRVRILDCKLAPGEKTAMHSHPALLAVILAPSVIRQDTPDGKSAEIGAGDKRGAVHFADATTHTSENIGKTPFHAILIEFKQPAPDPAKAAKISLPAPFKQVLDNAYVTTFQFATPAGSTTARHTHPDHITIALSNGSAELTNSDGKKQELTFKRDTAVFAGPGTHSAVNDGKTTVRLIDVELK